jgi:CRISPR system Cascade subunit CasE
MYLSRAFLNPTSSAVRADLADVASLHRKVMSMFPEAASKSARKEFGVLHRLDDDTRRGRLVLLVQSVVAPNFTQLDAGYLLELGNDLDWGGSGAFANPAVREVDEERARIRTGDRFAFRLLANTTRKILTKTGEDGARKNGKRVPVRGDEARLAWLARHAERGGFRVEGAQIVEIPSRHGRSRKVVFGGAMFNGVLGVTDPVAFRVALQEGVGPAKAFGFGLLSIQRLG